MGCDTIAIEKEKPVYEKRLFYVSTAGGFYAPEEYGFGYVKALAQNYYGIRDVRKIEALGLDIYGADVNEIMTAAADQLRKMN